jgi:MFS transporter, FHS family, glucose/mannose:H+ symporter
VTSRVSRTAAVWLLNAGFVVTGMVTTMLGPLLPWLSLKWGISDAEAGSLFTAQFAGALVAGASSGLLVERFREAWTLALGFGLMAGGVVALGIAGFATAVTGAAIAGLGMGCVVPTTNLLAARLEPERAAASLSLVNLSWGLGATTWPLVVGALSPAPNATLPVLAVLCGVTALATFGVTLPRVAEPDTRGGPRRAPFGRAALFGFSLLIYTGIETSLGGWMPEHARRMSAGGPAIQWVSASIAFWGGLTGGRALGSTHLERHREDRTALAGLVLAACCVVGLLAATRPAMVTVAALVGGLGLSVVFPVTVASMTRELPGRIAGPLVAFGGIGGATVPWLVGVLSSRADSLAMGLAALLVADLILLGLHVVRIRAVL